MERFGLSGYTITLKRSTEMAVSVEMDRVPEKAPTKPYAWQPLVRRAKEKIKKGVSDYKSS